MNNDTELNRLCMFFAAAIKKKKKMWLATQNIQNNRTNIFWAFHFT